MLCGDCRDKLQLFPDGVFQTCITSPPYLGHRRYGISPFVWGGNQKCQHTWGERLDIHRDAEIRIHGKTRTTKRFHINKSRTFNGSHQKHISGSTCLDCGAWLGSLGLEPTPELYVEHLIMVFREVWRVLRKDGTLWVNIGDGYCTGKSASDVLKRKDLELVPFRLALALQADGWWIRSDIIWHKPNPMPESVRDRTTKAHEYVFLCSKSIKYYYDQEAIREPYEEPLERWGGERKKQTDNLQPGSPYKAAHRDRKMRPNEDGRNKRTVWTIPTQPSSIEHYAGYPEKLIEPMILAGSSPKACPHCRAPWIRVVERIKFGRAKTESRLEDGIHKGSSSRRLAQKRQAYRAAGFESPPAPKTIGWRPSCSCEDNDGSGKSIILDPFMGSGTTGVVAKKHGRQWVGIDASSK